MKVTIGNVVVECTADELPAVINSAAKFVPGHGPADERPQHPEPAAKRKSGRPKGSKNKPKPKPKVEPPPVKRLLGPTEMLLNAVLENRVPAPFGRDGVKRLASIIYGRDTRDAMGNVWSLIDYHVKKGNMRRVAQGEYDLA